MAPKEQLINYSLDNGPGQVWTRKRPAQWETIGPYGPLPGYCHCHEFGILVDGKTLRGNPERTDAKVTG